MKSHIISEFNKKEIGATGDGLTECSTPMESVPAKKEPPNDILFYCPKCGKQHSYIQSTLLWFYTSIELGRLAEVKRFVQSGVPINARGKDGTTPLSRAIQSGHQDIVEFLRQHGAKE